MNTQLFIYALEVQKTGSITQAANNLFMSQPTLSKAIKELELLLGFAVFERSSKGVVPTQKGQEFLLHARKIVEQLQHMEQSLAAQDGACQYFSLAIPRVSYMAQAAAEQTCTFDGARRMEIDILETSCEKVIESVAYGHYALGVVRCSAEDEAYCIKSLERKGLKYEPVWRAKYAVLMRSDHPLAKQQSLQADDLAPYIEVMFGDEETPALSCGVSMPGAVPAQGGRRILVYDRAMQKQMLRSHLLAYAWASPMPQEELAASGLVQRSCRHSGEFVDLLICKNGYYFSETDRNFIDRLCLQRNLAAYGESPMPEQI